MPSSSTLTTDFEGMNRMTVSMTAFARVATDWEGGSIVWEVRSVNQRYLEMHFRMPDSQRGQESALRELLKSYVTRGKVECFLKVEMEEARQGFAINSEVLKQLNDAVDQVQHQFVQITPVNPLEVLQWPGVQATHQTSSEALNAAVLDGFTAALEQLSEVRAREGTALNSFILARADNIAEQVTKLRAIMPDLLANQRRKLYDRLQELLHTLNPDRIEQEMVLLANKMDVDEELDRLDTHLKEVRRLLTSSIPAVGRRLDFLMQELNREANTLSSKSIHASVTQTAVDFKVWIEQMREQIQNIE